MKIPIEELIKKTYRLNDTVLLGVGPMSENLVEACIELAKERDFPLMFIASRNQIDLKKFGGGYVGGWDQFDFADRRKRIADKYDFQDYYLCRDHGGPWQRDEERNMHLPLEEAMNIARESYDADIEAGFDLLMIDPTKDPFVMGKVVDIEFVLEKTVELIDYCEKKRNELNKPPIAYEVGTEETNGGLTESDSYDDFLSKLNGALDDRGLPRPIFAVGQTGTLVKSTMQAGYFDCLKAKELSEMAIKHGVYLKEHNADYLKELPLLEHVSSRVSAANVAPEFGTMETRAYLILCELELSLMEKGIIRGTLSGLRDTLLEAAVKTNRWKKWVSDEKAKMSFESIMNDKELSYEILDIAGHYTLNQSDVKEGITKLYDNLGQRGIEGNEFVKNYIKTAILRYVDCFNMSGLNKRIKG